MNRLAKQKKIITAMCAMIFQERKALYEKAFSMVGYEFGESEDEETAIAWTGAGLYVNRFREPEALPREETTKPAARRSLLNYRKDERASRRGLNSTGGMR